MGGRWSQGIWFQGFNQKHLLQLNRNTMTSTLWATPPQNFSIKEKSHISLFNTLGLWVKRPSLEVPTAVGEDGGEHDSSPRNLEGRGKNCTGNITSLAKVPRKCQNKMCWLRFGDEKSIPGVPEANPSTSQHPSQAEELVTCQFSSAPWTAPQSHLAGPQPSCTTH